MAKKANLDALRKKGKVHIKGERSGRKPFDWPLISISPSGRIGINRAAFVKYFERFKPDKDAKGGIRIVYVEEDNTILVDLIKDYESESNVYPIVRASTKKDGTLSRTAQVNAGKNLVKKTFGWDIRGRVNFDIDDSYYESDHVLILTKSELQPPPISGKELAKSLEKYDE